MLYLHPNAYEMVFVHVYKMYICVHMKVTCPCIQMQYACKEFMYVYVWDTLPSYSFFDNTSGAIYAGVPTVDFGWECNTDDCMERNGMPAV